MLSNYFWKNYKWFKIVLVLVQLKKSDELNNFNLNKNEITSFKHNSSDQYSNMLLKDEFLYVAGTNYIFRLNALNISDKSDQYFRERVLNATSTAIVHDSNKLSKTYLKNYIKFMHSRDNLKDIIVCGTNLGQPHIYDLKESDLTNQIEYNGMYLCPGVSQPNNLGLICFTTNYLIKNTQRINKNGIMYSAVWLTENQSINYGIFSRYGIFRMEIEEVNRNFLGTLFSPYWLWEPNFVAILEDSMFVYYFFTEFSIEEYINKYQNKREDYNFIDVLSRYTINSYKQLIRYSRAARVCKNDKGMRLNIKGNIKKDIWSTFRKIRMKCNCNQNLLKNQVKDYFNDTSFTFDHLFESNSYIISFSNLILAKQLNDKILAIFYQKFTNFLKTDNNEISMLCEFDMNTLKMLLISNNFWETPSNNSNKGKYKEIPNECQTSDTDTDDIFNKNNYHEKDDSNNSQNFLLENTILDGKFVGECKLILPSKIKSFSILESLSKNETQIYLANMNAQIFNVLRDKYGVYQLLDIVNLGDIEKNEKKSNFFNNINEILVNKVSNLIYVSTQSHVHQLNLNLLLNKSCNKYKNCEICNKDINCVWQINSKPYCISSKNKTMDYKPCRIYSRKREISDILIEFSQTLILKCDESIGYINNDVNWIKDGNKIDFYNQKINYVIGKSSELILLNTQLNYAGVYSCNIMSNELIVFNVTVRNEVLNGLFNGTNFHNFLNDSKTHYMLIYNWVNNLKNLTNTLKQINNECSKFEE